MPGQLLACPFCRELFSNAEADVCPQCDVPLRPLADLPPSQETLEQQAIDWERTAPEDRALPWTYARRGRGLLLGLSLLGLALFFAPWIVVSKPEIVTLSGFTLATSRGFWFAGGAIGWFISVPLIVSRRSVTEMRGVRVILTFFAATTACQAVLIYFNSPERSLIPISYEWGWGFGASALTSLLCVPLAMRFGGSLDDVRDEFKDEVPVHLADDDSQGEVLH